MTPNTQVLSSQVCARSPPTRPYSSVSKEGEFAGQEDLRNHFIFSIFACARSPTAIPSRSRQGSSCWRGNKIRKPPPRLSPWWWWSGSPCYLILRVMLMILLMRMYTYLCSIEEQATHPRKRGINPILRARPTIYYGTCSRGPSNGKQKSQKEHF